MHIWSVIIIIIIIIIITMLSIDINFCSRC